MAIDEFNHFLNNGGDREVRTTMFKKIMKEVCLYRDGNGLGDRTFLVPVLTGTCVLDVSGMFPVPTGFIFTGFRLKLLKHDRVLWELQRMQETKDFFRLLSPGLAKGIVIDLCTLPRALNLVVVAVRSIGKRVNESEIDLLVHNLYDTVMQQLGRYYDPKQWCKLLAPGR